MADQQQRRSVEGRDNVDVTGRRRQVGEVQFAFMGGGEDGATWCVDGDGMGGDANVGDRCIDRAEMGGAASIGDRWGTG